MSTTKSIPKEEWKDRLNSFSSGHRGLVSAITVDGMTVVEGRVLRDLEYDPVGKGNDLVITVG